MLPVSFSPDPFQSNAQDQNGSEEISCTDDTQNKLLISKLPQCARHVVVRRASAVSMKAPMTLCNKNIQAVVDSGAEVTVMSRDLFYSLPKEQRPDMNQANKGLIVAEEDHILPTEGVVTVPLTIGDLKFEWPVYVAAILDEVLLGCDLLDAKDITLNTRKGLFINGSWLPCYVNRRPDHGTQVFLENKVCVPPNTEFIAYGKMENSGGRPNYQMAVLEPYTRDPRDFLVARALVDCRKEVVPIRLVNLSESDVCFQASYIIGEIHPVDTVINMNQSTAEIVPVNDSTLSKPKTTATNYQVFRIEKHVDQNKLPTSLPGHLQDLYQRSLSNLEKTEYKEKLATLLYQHQDVFAKHRTDLGTCSVLKHRIDTNGAAPIRQALRRTPKAFEQEEETYLNEQLEAGVLVPSSSAWASPVVLVRKKDGTVRWCCDFRKLNDLTVKEAYPLPRIDMCLDALGSACLFSTMDLQSGYWQLEVDEADRHKTAIITKYGLFEYAKLPMGLCNSPSSFQRCMELILRGLQWKTVLIYLDDIIVFSSSLDEHLVKLREVFQLLQSSGLKLKPAKCDLLKKEVLFLGHIVGVNGIRPNPKLIDAVKKWVEPTTVKQVQQFLGLCNYYRRFVYQFSEIASPLTKLTEKKADFHWDQECQVAFDGLKEALCEAPVLAYPRSSGLFIVDTDASNTGVGGVLSQLQDDEEKVIWYASKKLSRAQRQYCVTRRELLAAVIFLQEFRHYILGQEFILRTDHNSLRWIFTFK